jgi:hypothetical protein
MAASTIGLSTFVFGFSGVASAAVGPITFSTDPTDEVTNPLAPGDPIVIPVGYCSVDWYVTGAAGGADSDGNPGANGTEVDATTAISGAQTFTVTLGEAGGDGTTAGGTGGAGGTGDDGSDGIDDGSGTYFGGGGGATTVSTTGGLFLEAPGGDGAGASGDGDGAGGGAVQTPAGATDVASAPGGSNPGVYATAQPCPTPPAPPAAPGAPHVNWVSGDGEHSLAFQIDRSTLPNGASITGTEYSTNGGDTWNTVSTRNAGDYEYSGSITGLTTAHQYSVLFRFQTTAGAGDPSDATTASTLLPAPTGVTAVVGGSTVTVSWQPPAGTWPITGYTAHAAPVVQDQQSGNEPPHCDTTAAAARSCVIVVPAGAKYRVVVQAEGNELGGVSSDPLTTDTITEPTAPATVPTGADALTSPSGALGTLTPGKELTLTGSGYAPNSTVSLYIYSTPTLLGTVVTDASGNFSKAVTVPANLAPGGHHLVSAGVDANGSPRYLRTDVTVAAAANQLAWTGFETMPYVGAGVLAVAAGVGMVLITRRRRTA